MKDGDWVVAKVTQYSTTAVQEDIVKAITPETPAWVIGQYVSDLKDYDLEHETIIIGPPELTSMSLMHDMYDKWELPPPEEWPDEVCAALAKRALLGEEE